MNLTTKLGIVIVTIAFATANVSADVTTSGEVGVYNSTQHSIIYLDPLAWTSSTTSYIGGYGHGTMNVDGNGSDHDVTCGTSFLGWRPGSSGDVLVDGGDSTWTLSGIYVGDQGDGTLTILGSGEVLSSGGTIANASGTTGKVTVDGFGSAWKNSSSGSAVYIGADGNGVLNILNGGMVQIRGTCYVGNGSASNSVLSVVGSSSLLDANNNLYVGRNSATGALYIGQGGKVDVDGMIEINAGSTATIDVSNDNMLVAAGTWGGTLMNNGTIRLTARPQLSAGVYRPIVVEPDPYGGPAFWGGSGVYEAIGGTWDSSSHTFSVSTTLNTSPGTKMSIDLANYQRLNVGTDLTVSFQSGPEILSFIASRSSSTLAGLLGSLGVGESVLSSWDFDITGLTAGKQTMLSYAVTGDPSDVRVWRYDGTSWSQYTGSNVYVEDGHATFTVDGFSSYAVTGVGAPVPEPTMLVLLAMGVCGLALLHRCGDNRRR